MGKASPGSSVPAQPSRPTRDPGDQAWELTFERSPIGMAVVLPDGSWARVNQALCEMLTMSAAELTACTFQDITHPADLAADVDLLQECIAGLRDGYRMTKRYVRSDGQLVWGDLSVALVRHADGRPMHFISQILDITDQRADRDRLEQAFVRVEEANRDLEAFTAIASHELKSPLTGVRASLELIGDLLSDPTPDREAITTAVTLALRAESSVDRMATLLDALLALTLTKVGLGRAPDQDAAHRVMTLPPITIATVLDATLDDLPDFLKRPDVSIERGPAIAEAPPLAAEPNLVRTIVTTLIANAVKYRDPHRHLSITIDAAAHTDPTFITLSVSNDGPPIAPADRDRVFALHTRGSTTGDSSASGPVHGAGIGLAVSRSIVEWHGGLIWIDGGPAAGVGIHFTLPLA